MANELHGKAGDVTVGGSTVSGINSWTVSYTGDVVEVTNFTDTGIKRYIAGGSGWSGSFSGFKTGAPTAIGSEIALVLKESATATQKWVGQAILTNISSTGSVNGAITYSYNFQGTGALTVPTA